MLGRLALDLGLYEEAARRFETALDDQLVPRDRRSKIFERCVAALEEGRDSIAVERVLHRWSFELPDESDPLMKLSCLAADSAQYEKPYRFLEKAVRLRHGGDGRPEPHADESQEPCQCGKSRSLTLERLFEADSERPGQFTI